MRVAGVLDPRYKIELLEYYYVKLYGNDANDQVKLIQQLCYDLLYEYQLKINNSSSSDSQMLGVNFSNVEDDGLEDYDLYVRKKKARTSFVKIGLDIYLEEEVLPRSSYFDILLWWKLNGVKYPTLQTIAKDVLAILVFYCSF
ncbi:zinc finger BED domain-containing protein DAYSLEEPER-like [Cicer arietinum]|uniref:zinc finger BED domain-containing protein DAYSLEEPER-like n=1 Tax=Cicer arietinum TaxID=3827 RepID=UPI003CC65600